MLPKVTPITKCNTKSTKNFDMIYHLDRLLAFSLIHIYISRHDFFNFEGSEDKALHAPIIKMSHPCDCNFEILRKFSFYKIVLQDFSVIEGLPVTKNTLG